uniref:Uncharacterized protein n=1 Tax=Podarcis muralis TaxID=64176 RepID=A0A670JMI9_PODMU
MEAGGGKTQRRKENLRFLLPPKPQPKNEQKFYPPTRPARPGSPWRCEWPRCWGRLPAGSPGRSAGTRGLASHRSRPLPGNKTCTAICSSSVMVLRSGRPARPNSCWPMVILSRASSESRAHEDPRLREGDSVPDRRGPALSGDTSGSRGQRDKLHLASQSRTRKHRLPSR